jgi:hypothetical protein
MSEPLHEGRTALADIVAGWDVPAAHSIIGSIADTVKRGLFQLSPDGKVPSLIFPNGTPHYRLGAQTALPGPIEVAIFGAAAGSGTIRLANLRDRRGPGRGEDDFFPPRFVNASVRSFAECLDESIRLDVELDQLSSLNPAEWSDLGGEERTIVALTDTTRRIRDIDSEALTPESFWFSTLEGLWGELVDDGDERFEALI